MAEVQDIPGRIASFTEDGTFTDQPVGITYHGKTIKVPCCDVFRVRDGRIASSICYPSGTVLFGRLGVLTNLEAALG